MRLPHRVPSYLVFAAVCAAGCAAAPTDATIAADPSIVVVPLEAPTNGKEGATDGNTTKPSLVREVPTPKRTPVSAVDDVDDREGEARDRNMEAAARRRRALIAAGHHPPAAQLPTQPGYMPHMGRTSFPQVRLLAPSIAGDLELHDMSRVLSRARTWVMSCYRVALRLHPGRTGSAVAKVVVRASGAVDEVSFVASSLYDRGLERCIAQRFARLQFVAHKHASVVRIPMFFMPPRQP